MKNRAWVTWGIIFAILLGSGILTIVIPALLGGDSAAALPREQSAITINSPIAIAGSTSLTLASWQVMLALALLVPALVIGAGLTLGIVLVLLARFVNRTKESTQYQQNARPWTSVMLTASAPCARRGRPAGRPKRPGIVGPSSLLP